MTWFQNPPEGVSHGFLVLLSVDGKTLASGDLIQVVRNKRLRVKNRDSTY
jgi:hypothetical protein